MSRISHLKGLYGQSIRNVCLTTERIITSGANVGDDDPLYSDVPKPRRDKSERKPYVTPMKNLIQRAKEEKEARKAQPCRLLEHPPDNGLLVPELIPVSHQVYQARESLLLGVLKLLQVVPIQRCR